MTKTDQHDWYAGVVSITLSMEMGTALKGTVHGRTVELDEEVVPLDGQRVLVVLEPIPEETLPGSEAADEWRTWVQRGPQGPIEDEGEPEFP